MQGAPVNALLTRPLGRDPAAITCSTPRVTDGDNLEVFQQVTRGIIQNKAATQCREDQLPKGEQTDEERLT